jgi:hypothetical protein
MDGSSKIPSVIYYDKDGAVHAIGAETSCDGMYDKAQEEGWTNVEWSVFPLPSVLLIYMLCIQV